MQLSPEAVKNNLFSVISDMAAAPWLFSTQKTAFSRKRKISFTDTILSVLSMEKSSSKHEMLKYFDFSADTPSLSALIQQRSKLSPEAFQILFRDFTDSFNFGKNLKGYRLLAVDGSDICIPRDPEDPETYRISDPYGKGYNLLHLNALYDLLSRTYIDAILQPCNSSNEYSAMCDMVDHFRQISDEKVIFIADRGYTSFNVMAHVIENNARFLIRARDEGSRNLLSTLTLPASPEFDIDFERWLTRRNTRAVKEQPDIYKNISSRPFDYLREHSSSLYYIRFRIVRFQLPNGSSETVFTNLPAYEFDVEQLKELYFKRWGIETSFRELKYTIGLAYFHSRKKQLIMQEIYARLILYNFCEIITGTIIVSQKDRKFIYQVNFTMAIYICIEFLRRKKSATQMDVIALINNYILPIRLGRNSPRYIKARTVTSFLYR